MTIEIEDKATLGGTAHLELIFDPVTFALKQWTVIDAQGFQTVVTLFNIDLKTKPDPALFHIDENLRRFPGDFRVRPKLTSLSSESALCRSNTSRPSQSECEARSSRAATRIRRFDDRRRHVLNLNFDFFQN